MSSRKPKPLPSLPEAVDYARKVLDEEDKRNVTDLILRNLRAQLIKAEEERERQLAKLLRSATRLHKVRRLIRRLSRRIGQVEGGAA